MQIDDFIGYIGDPDFHDGTVVEVKLQDDGAMVQLQGGSGVHFFIGFLEVEQINSYRPENMIIYALSEMKCQAPMRHFVFVNWDDEDGAHLEIFAKEFQVHKVIDGRKIQAILRKGKTQIQTGEGIEHQEFWEEIEAET